MFHLHPRGIENDEEQCEQEFGPNGHLHEQRHNDRYGNDTIEKIGYDGALPAEHDDRGTFPGDFVFLIVAIVVDDKDVGREKSDRQGKQQREQREMAALNEIGKAYRNDAIK